MDCFAYEKIDKDGEEVFLCTVQETLICEGRACPFYKSKKQVEKEREKIRKRLESLPPDKQSEIKRKYNLNEF